MQIQHLKPEQSRVFLVLHADSDLLMRKIISNVFSNETFQLDSAANGKEAFAFLEAKGYQYDIVITEMHMQYANGYEIINKVMKESPGTKTIITSNMSYLHIREGLEIVREDCFKKPLVVGKLLERVKHIMGGDSQEIEVEVADPLGVLLDPHWEEPKIDNEIRAQESAINELFVAESIAKEETLAIEILPEQDVLVAVEQKPQAMSGKRWW